MKPLLVLLCCLLLAGCHGSVVVWWPELHAGEWWVPFEVHGQSGVARCGTREESYRLYAVLAASMIGHRD